jgi:hypothetical protein
LRFDLQSRKEHDIVAPEALLGALVEAVEVQPDQTT